MAMASRPKDWQGVTLSQRWVGFYTKLPRSGPTAPFIRALVETRSIPVVKFCIDRCLGLLHCDHDYMFRYAAEIGDLPLCKFLVQQGVSCHARKDDALKRAVRNGHAAVCAFLFEQGAMYYQESLYIRDLCRAAERGYTQLCRVLLREEPSVAQFPLGDLDKAETLRHAIRGGHLDTCRMFIQEYGFNSFDALSEAATRATGAIEIIAMLLERHGTRVDDLSRALITASMYDRNDTCQFLMAKGADPRSHDQVAFQWTAPSGNLELAKIFRKHGCHPRYCTTPVVEGTMLENAAVRGYDKYCEWLLGLHPFLELDLATGIRDIDKPLRAVLARKFHRTACVLFNHGANVDVPILLEECIASEDLHGCRLLLENGAAVTRTHRALVDETFGPLSKAFFQNWASHHW